MNRTKSGLKGTKQQNGSPIRKILINYLTNNERCERKIYIYRISLRCHRRTIPSIAAPRLYTQIRGVRKLKGTLHENFWNYEHWDRKLVCSRGSLLFVLNIGLVGEDSKKQAHTYNLSNFLLGQKSRQVLFPFRKVVTDFYKLFNHRVWLEPPGLTDF